MTYVVLEFPVEIRFPDGSPSGNCRGWIPGDEPVPGMVGARVRVVGRTEDPREVERLIEEGRCVAARRLFDALAGLEMVGLDPGRVRPRVWEHIRHCADCTVRYQEVLAEILSDGGECEQSSALG